MKIENYGAGHRCSAVLGLLLSFCEEHPAQDIDRIIILPIPTSRDGVHISGTDRLVSEVSGAVASTDAVCGYAIPGRDREMMIFRGAKVYDAAQDEAFLTENARLTAEGTLGHILTASKKSPRDMKIGIVGYGRIGRYLAGMLLSVGAGVRVYTSKNATRVALGECGVESEYMGEECGVIPNISGLDIIVNTAPKPLGQTFPSGIPAGLSVIEVASGDNFAGVSGVVRLPSIPDRLYPESSAKLYFEGIKRHLFGGAL